MEWDRITLALNVLAIDPEGVKGLWLRARASAVRDRITTALAALPLPLVRLHPGVADDALYGGLDLSATLATGRPVQSRGLLSSPAALILTMAERVPPGLSARLAHALDTRRHCLIALDEAAEDGEGLPAALTDRLGLFVDLDGLAWSDTTDIFMNINTLSKARARLPSVTLPPDAASALTRAAAELGIRSLRAPLLAMAAARALAAHAGRDTVGDNDLQQAAELIYGHRALPLPDATAQDQPEPPPPDPGEDQAQDMEHQAQSIPEEMLVEAARAALPADLLAQLAAGRAARSAKGATGTGAERGGNRRGRPLPSRPGKLGSGARLDLVATLRAAAPWQPLRRRTAPSDAVLLVRASDIRIKRFVEASDRVLIFAVDASGSAAFARLAEAKGAVELLLAAAYARRDHVALVAFRGTGAEVILPPTRSLVQTKRRLAGLPGGGGTPLAAGMQAAMATATLARARGLTPTIALLTDGRGNIALDGSANRAQAEEDALRLARAIRATGMPAVVIDTANRPQPSLAAMARAMDAPYLALPRADARRLSGVLGAALGG
ncbi:MAG: magnesium chelatase subunit D [Pseudotabrizicola sp.]|uniref:magnesium chelatase subunit D n=1 Tax=Pseudotabrizicola sp. TaxID=2939647 RepID=UPI0027248D4E|nr:magnesium chelatase subunit D [Pseudotabrizicola sp.]MDO8881700.1 magnesium chelatase subunit D [Pseudotabrizicola sp.]MDP2079841.1 magnesium chelatase subunit D [Pseudotabrizicola sp.]MDZ7574842.1 magnesium chelatase subunit D [Pseudotabrizicola sp.]